jgi:hypothetical protein
VANISYFVIGMDGRPHGPLSTDDLHAWIADGRAGKYSRVRLDGETAWRSLQDLQEFAASFKRPATFQPASAAPAAAETRPPIDGQDLDQIAANYALHARKVNVGASFRRAWNLVSQRFIELAGWSALFGLVEILIFQIAFVAWTQSTNTADAPPSPPAAAAPMELLVSPAILPLLVVNGVLTGVLYFVFLNAIRGRRLRPGEIWSAVAATIGQLLLTWMAQLLLTFVGAFLLLPGIYLAVAYVFALPLAIDKRLPFWSALEVSRRVVSRQWWAMSLVFLLCLGLPFLGGQLPYGIGLVLLMPICTAALMYTYEDLFGA